jgi:hypothetical protein
MSNMNIKQSSKKVKRDYDLNIAHTGYNEAENGKSKTQFSIDQIEDFNDFCIKNFDKWNRMFKGIASSIIRYENEIFHIEIKNSETQVDSTKGLAEEIAGQWHENIKRYTSFQPKAFVIYLYNTNRLPGYFTTKSTSEEEKEQLKKDSEVKEKTQLIGILPLLQVRREK